jgi:hypothetical protein
MVLPNTSKSRGRPVVTLAPPSIQATMKASPWATYMVPRVAMTGVIFRPTTRAPLARPKPEPIRMDSTRARGVGMPFLLMKAYMTPVRASTMPTDRSKAPEIINSTAAEPVSMIMATCMSTLIMFT